MPAAIATDAGNPVTNSDGTYRIAERTTDVNELPQFGDRVRTRVPDGTPVTGWRAQDFTPAEIEQLRAVGRLPFRGRFARRPGSDPDLPSGHRPGAASKRATGRAIGIDPETEHPTS